MSAARSVFDDRHRGRVAALQLLYQLEFGGVSPSEVDEMARLYWTEHPVPEGHRSFATTLLQGTVERRDQIDPLIEGAADNWRLSRMSVVDRTILRLGVYELLVAVAPPAVVINEALELAKTFGGEESSGFVNGVLDAVKRVLEKQSNLPRLPGELEARDPKIGT